MPTFRLAILERLAIMAIGFSDFRILGLRGLLRLGHIWAFCLATSVSCGSYGDLL